MTARKSDIPFAGNFSPEEVQLATVLALADKHQGDRRAFEHAIRLTYYDRPQTRLSQRPKLAYNVALGMHKYGLIEKDASLTPLGKELLMLSSDTERMHRRFAKHILVDLRGALLLDCVRDMHASGERMTLISIRRALEERGVHTARANKSISLMRMWLDEAKITSGPSWILDEAVYREVVGASGTELAALASFTPEQRAVAKALAEIGVAVDSSKLRITTERAYSIQLNEKSFPKVLKPLADAGLLTFKAAGGKSAPVTPLPPLLEGVTIPLIEQLGQGLPPGLRALLRRPIQDIVAALDSTSGYEKGLALEALGFKIMRSIGLDYRATRFRPSSGGRFEVDLLFDSQRLAYSRWQVQCKNTDRVSLDDIAKEVGLVFRLLSNVILILTRGSVGDEARRYARDVMNKTSLAIILMDGKDVACIVEDPLSVYAILDREAAFAISVKPLEGTA